MICEKYVLSKYSLKHTKALSFSSQNPVSVPWFLLHSAFTHRFHLCILLAIAKYKYIEITSSVKIYTRNQGVNKEIAAISTSETQVLCTPKFAKQNHA